MSIRGAEEDAACRISRARENAAHSSSLSHLGYSSICWHGEYLYGDYSGIPLGE
jgi:hypothetical protein